MRNAARTGQTKFEVRAAFIRFLALGGDTQATVHEQGVHLQGAWINGSLDLRSCSVDRDLYLDHCTFDQTVVFYQASVKTLSFQGSSLVGLKGDRLQAAGSLFLRGKGDLRFVCCGEIRLLGARISGNLALAGAELIGPAEGKGNALHCDRIQVDGNLVLRSIENQRFTCRGEIRLLGARIGGDLDLVGAKLVGTAEGTANALSCDGMQVAGGLFMRTRENFKFSCSGRLSLSHAKVGVLVDDLSCWPSEIALDGFTFDALGGDATPDPQARIQWLKTQPTKHLTTSFRPQPWTHLIKTLRRMGYKREAAEVGVAYQRQRRAAGRIGPKWHLRSILHWLYDRLCGYGYQPLHAVYWLAGVWLLSGLLYWYAAEQGVFAPSQAPIANNAVYAPCRPDRPLPENAYRNWYNCPALPASDYPTFAPFAYSLDVILPAVDLQQERLWAPAAPTFAWPPPNNSYFWLPTMVRWLMWFEILFGWTLSGLLLAVLSGLAKPEGTE